MKNAAKFAVALFMTGTCFTATAQGTKPMMPKETKKEEKMETKKEEKMETMKEEKMEHAKGEQKMHHSGKMHHTKMAEKPKM